LDHQNNYIENLKMMNNAANDFDFLAIDLNVLIIMFTLLF